MNMPPGPQRAPVYDLYSGTLIKPKSSIRLLKLPPMVSSLTLATLPGFSELKGTYFPAIMKSSFCVAVVILLTVFFIDLDMNKSIT